VSLHGYANTEILYFDERRSVTCGNTRAKAFSSESLFRT
jgi:hypothetical protein